MRSPATAFYYEPNLNIFLRMKTISRIFISSLAVLILLVILVSIKTYVDIQPVNASLRRILSDAQALQVTDRNGYPLTITYKNRWNTYDNLTLYQIPDFLKTAFIASEDQNYYQHHGVDWQSRLAAIFQNARSQRTIRGASTITEQVVRMIHPRSRSVWSKWIEGFEAINLERRYSKADIFEFYLNQVPYAANRRGVLQAARFYFDRDLSTLTKKEMLALVVLARAPSSYNLYKNLGKIDGAILRLAGILVRQKKLDLHELQQIRQEHFSLKTPTMPVNAAHFINYVRSQASATEMMDHLHTTLDANLQNQVQLILDERLRNLHSMGVRNAAAIVVDHTTGEIVAWVVAGANSGNSANPVPGYQIDAVTVPRQPGSALKPFLYAGALQSGWTPATLIDDSPYSEAVGTGIHRFKNYSNGYYGKVTLREALGNSLNIPALHTIRYVGTGKYLQTLHALGFESLDRGEDIYDEGLALGNGEVTLLELTQAYAALANRGVFRHLRFLMNDDQPATAKRVFSPEVSSLVANILSDPYARRLEFGENSVLNLPVQTAAKTGTSTDYRDAWTMAFNYRYVVGIWMGNLDHTPMNGVTGVIGPALAMRSIFYMLNRNQKTAPLYLSPKLVASDVCVYAFQSEHCMPRTEYFITGTEPSVQVPGEPSASSIKFVLPTQGLQVAVDPRIPLDSQRLKFQLSGLKPDSTVTWVLNDTQLAVTSTSYYLWQPRKGQYRLGAIVVQAGHEALHLPEISFIVK